MRSGENQSDEDAAMDLLVAILGGTAEEVDRPGGPPGLRDFDVHLVDGRTVAVEVTRHTVQRMQGQQGAIQNRCWRFSELKYNWHVQVTSDCRINVLHSALEELLASLEEHPNVTPGIFDDPRFGPIGVSSVCRGDSAGPSGGDVSVVDAIPLAPFDESDVVQAVEDLASKEDNLWKLQAAADHFERHLFVWVDEFQPGALAAIGFLGEPNEHPGLPECVDAVWVADYVSDPTVLQYHRSHGWRRCPFAPV
jgi:hypothetical protein